MPTPGPQAPASRTGRNKCLLFGPPDFGPLLWQLQENNTVVQTTHCNRRFLKDGRSGFLPPKKCIPQIPFGVISVLN